MLSNSSTGYQNLFAQSSMEEKHGCSCELHHDMGLTDHQQLTV